jgi:hypothetical protein
VLSKTYQYATNYNKISIVLRQVSVKDAQTSFKRTITWGKNLGKGGKNRRKHVLKVGYYVGS